MKNFALIAAALLMSGAAYAQPTINGTVAGDESFYGSALSIQNTQTQFGDANLGDAVNGGGGSEINQVFGTVDNGRLYVMVTGNLEVNFNKLNIFIDSDSSTGVNTLDEDALPRGMDAFCCGGFEPPNGNNTTNFGALQRMDGLTFDSAFTADYALAFSHGGESVDSDQLNPLTDEREESPNRISFYAMNAHFADLTQGLNGDVAALGVLFAPDGQPNVQRAAGDTLADNPNQDWLNSDTKIGPALPGLAAGQLIDRDYALSTDGGCADDTGAGCVAPELKFVLDVDPSDVNADPAKSNLLNHRNFSNTVDLELAFNNSNTEGVRGGSGGFTVLDDDNPETVQTGIEFSIPLSEIGNPTGDIRIAAFINGSGHNYAANQFAGDGILQGNLGGDGTGGFTDDLSGVDLSTIAGDQFVTVANSVALPPGDYNQDGVVDAADYTVWRDNEGSTTNLAADGDGSGTVDAADYTIWVNNYGTGASASSSAAVPEPGALVLVGLAVAGLASRRRS